MSHEVTQWLAEIKALKQQLIEVQQEREQAYASAANWQRLYETEAQQRRTEAALARQTIADLKQAIQTLEAHSFASANPETAQPSLQAEIAQLPAAELQQRLLSALVEREQLLQALKNEQASHTQTRKSLTTALGDAIDQLAREKAGGD